MAEGTTGKKCQPVTVAFTHHGEEKIGTRSKQDQRWPAGHLQLMPEVSVAVVHHRVADIVTKDGTANIVQDLRGMSRKTT